MTAPPDPEAAGHAALPADGAAGSRPAAAGDGADVLARLTAVLQARRSADPDQSYVARLFAKGPDAILKKIGEEATETVLAAKDGAPERIIAETADLWFHCLVMLSYYGLSADQVLAELARREGLSGLDEKASRRPQKEKPP